MIDENNNKCLTRVNQLFSSTSNGCSNDMFGSNSCPTNCRNTLNNGVNAMGCCAYTIMAMLDFSEALNGGLNVNRLVNYTTNVCNIAIPNACAASKKLNFSMTTNNLRFTYYTANKASVEQKLKADMALVAIVSPSDITVNAASEFVNTRGPNGVRFEMTIKVASTQQVNNIEANLKDKLNLVTPVSLPKLSELPTNSRYDAASPSTINAQSSTVVTDNNSPATLAVPGLTALFAMLFSAFLLF